MANKLRDALALFDVPETNGTVPGGRESEAGVTGEADLRDEVRVTSVKLLGATSLHIGIIRLLEEFPLDHGAIAGAGEEEFLSVF
jgi:hypothetical protein